MIHMTSDDNTNSEVIYVSKPFKHQMDKKNQMMDPK